MGSVAAGAWLSPVEEVRFLQEEVLKLRPYNTQNVFLRQTTQVSNAKAWEIELYPRGDIMPSL